MLGLETNAEERKARKVLDMTYKVAVMTPTTATYLTTAETVVYEREQLEAFAREWTARYTAQPFYGKASMDRTCLYARADSPLGHARDAGLLP